VPVDLQNLNGEDTGMAIVKGSGNSQPTKIRLQTRNGNDIDNQQDWELTRLDWAAVVNVRKTFPPPLAIEVSSACPVYNCHGLTFASRRTLVTPDNQLLDMILREDGYEEVQPKEARAGDVVLYFDEDGAIDHSGFVIGTEGVGVRVPRVWGKWGKGPEMVHAVGNCPYNAARARYFRLRAWPKPKGI
jgi:hypothetical protein